MTAAQIEALFEAYGVPAHLERGDLGRLEQHLAAGRGVVLGVDASEVAGTPDGVVDADHVLLVTGIDRDRDVVVLNDPGRPDGAAVEVPVAALAGAWADSGNQMIVAGVAAPPPAGAGSGGDDGGAGASGWVIIPTVVGGAGALLAILRVARRAREARDDAVDAAPGAPRPRLTGPGIAPPPPRLPFGDGALD
jgi:hypothetical protein